MKKRILIIDDEEQDRKALTRALKKEGFNEILCAETGGKGIEVLKTFKPDIVLIDVRLEGGIDGLDICRNLKSAEAGKPKVIMITGHLDAISAEKARNSCADEILEKNPCFTNICNFLRRLE